MSHLLRECICGFFTFPAHNTQCVISFMWHCGDIYFPLQIALNILDHNKLMENEGLGKKNSLQMRMQHNLYKGNHKWDNMSRYMLIKPHVKNSHTRPPNIHYMN